MLISIFYLILAILGLGFLIFIHELGHYFVARREGMTVEVFSIGFGPPIHQWNIHGVKWQICMIPFGGYVRIAGMDKKGGVEPHQIPDGFFGKKPIQRIRVALAGPVVNILFALVAFTIIWISGGQEKSFQLYTHVIGYVDPQSKFYSSGVRPGDELLCVNNKPFDGFQDLLISLAFEEKVSDLRGNEIDYFTEKKDPFTLQLPRLNTSIPFNMDQIGFSPAQYLIFEDFSSPASSLKNSGILKGDRIVWVDGELIFSTDQLSSVLNTPKVLLTVERKGNLFLAGVPRLKVSDLCLKPEEKSELDDWQHAVGLKTKVSGLYFIPYLLTPGGTVDKSLQFMDCNAEQVKPVPVFRSPLAVPLEPGDVIKAVDGIPVTSGIDIFKKIQTRNALVMVQREPPSQVISWKKADPIFESSFHTAAIEKLIRSIGTKQPLQNMDNVYLLPPISLKSFNELDLEPKTRAAYTAIYEAQKKEIEKIENPEQRNQQLEILEKSQTRLMLGASLRDRSVAYNPSPLTLIFGVFDQTWKTLRNLVTGNLSPKALTGPVGIVKALQVSWASGVKNALFWLGFVSLNLAILNLLPIPVLDGGHILFSTIEGVTKKPIKTKTMEKLVIPFLVLLVLLFIYLTYQDILKLLHKWF